MRPASKKATRVRGYARFREIDGSHALKRAVPDGFVEYRARRLRNGDVVYFNFALAREMGLVSRRHPDRMNEQLRRAILDTFALVIVNEYDIRRGTRFSKRDLLPNRYMATRYLQLQHADRLGRTSGDGRSVWNGSLTHRGVTWDLTSCGTGVTRLCPATAEKDKFFKTGSNAASYGCGTATLEEGLASALMSETFHRNGIATERVLAVIELENGFAINVRAGRNLLRPSHFFLHSKQGRLSDLRGSIDCFIARQMANGEFPKLRGNARYRFLAEEMARKFARVAATFEREYVFCWLDWDGDNILADGGIIDYGSVRQFGLYHREYRFDDGPRWSTTIPEQRGKARLIVQNFAQIRDFLIEGKRSPLRSFACDPVLRRFDAEFDATRDRLLLRNVGYTPKQQRLLLERARPLVRRFERAHAYFERARSARGPRKVNDGIVWNAVFSTRDLLRELAPRYLQDYASLPAEEFLRVALSSYASRNDRRPNSHRRRKAVEFQQTYLGLIRRAAALECRPLPSVLKQVAERSAVINRFDRITGDSALYAARKLLRQRRQLSSDALYELVDRFVRHQTLVPDLRGDRGPDPFAHPDVKRIFDSLLALTAECRHGL
jgi:hypothetical protein